MEREMGFEPTTPTLATLCSTTELLPLERKYIYGTRDRTWTGTALLPRDFKSLVSTISTTPAYNIHKMEATPRFELGMEILQTSALPLGDVALI